MTDLALRAGQSDSIVARLDALLEFDREAASAYREAAERLGSESLRRRALHFCEDHERHLDELTRLRRAYGGGRAPAAGSTPPGMGAERASEIATLVGDRAILRALKTLARSGRDSYRRAVQDAFPAEVSAVLRRASNDETTHYAWALEMLDDLDADGTALRRGVGVALDNGGARLTSFVEVVERRSTAAVSRVREGVSAELGAHPVRAAIVALGVGMCAATLGRRRVEAT